MPEFVSEHIKNNFGFGRVEFRNDLFNNRYVIDSFVGCNFLTLYLDKFKLYHVSKLISYLKWKKYLNIILSLKHSKNINVKRLFRLGQSINKLS